MLARASLFHNESTGFGMTRIFAARDRIAISRVFRPMRSGFILSLAAKQICEDPSYPCHPCAIARSKPPIQNLKFERSEHALHAVLNVPDAAGHNIPNPVLCVKHDEVGIGAHDDFPFVLQP